MFKKRLTPFLCVIICFAVMAVSAVSASVFTSLKSKEEIRLLREQLCESGSDSIANTDFGDDYGKYKKLADIIGYIDDNYIREYDKDAVWDAVYKAYARSVGDLYSEYFTSDEYKALTEESAGNFVGIGVHAVFDTQTPGIYIFRVMPSSPAQAAGILDGDTIISVEGTDCTEDNYYDMLDLIRGEEGTEVSVSVKRGEDIIDFTLNRASVASENVVYEKLDGNIAYIRIFTFSDFTLAEQFGNTLKIAQDDGCEKYIFDVRNNSGGYLTEICSVLDMLLPEGVLINIVDANGNKRTENSDAEFLDAPMAVLCNGNTASAAELFVAALRDYEAAFSIGQTTYGKGTMQNTHVYEDGSAIKTSVAYYNPPCNISYDGVGITPDYTVALAQEWEESFFMMPRSEDIQLQKAIEVIKNK